MARSMIFIIRHEEVLGEADFGSWVGQIVRLVPIPTDLAAVVGRARLPFALLAC